VTTGQLVHILEGHTDWVKAVALTPDGRLAVSASDDGTLIMWDLATGQVQLKLKTNAPLWCVAIAPNGQTIVVGDKVGAVHFIEWVRWNH